MEFLRLHKYHIWYFGLHFSNIGYWGYPSKANNAVLGYSVVKKVKMIFPNIIKKLKITWKYSKFPLEITSKFLGRREKRKAAGVVGVFCQNLGITAYTLESYSNFKSRFSFNKGNIFEIHCYFRTRGNSRFNDFSQLINTFSLSNEDFAGLDNFNKLENLFCAQGFARNLNWCHLKEKNKNCRKKDFLI